MKHWRNNKDIERIMAMEDPYDQRLIPSTRRTTIKPELLALRQKILKQRKS